MTEYVAGFLFDIGRKYVVLIEKQRPQWQAGRWNAVGGHVEPDEAPVQAMRREFREETGVDVDKWDHFCTLTGDGFRVHWYRAFCDNSRIFDVKTVTDERVNPFWIPGMPANTMTNVRWLLEMALSMDNDKAESFEIHERYPAAA